MRVINAAFLICLAASTFSVGAQQQAESPCPTIKLDGPPNETMIDDILTFSVDLEGNRSDARPAIKWSVSAGQLTSGQGTPSITVSTIGLIAECLTVTVEFDGLKAGCPRTAIWRSLIATCCIHPWEKFDEYSGDLTHKEEKERLDNVAIYFQHAPPDSRLRIIGNEGSNRRKGTAAKRVERARDYLIKNHGIEPSRIVTGPKFPERGTSSKLFSIELIIEPVNAIQIPPCKKVP